VTAEPTPALLTLVPVERPPLRRSRLVDRPVHGHCDGTVDGARRTIAAEVFKARCLALLDEVEESRETAVGSGGGTGRPARPGDSPMTPAPFDRAALERIARRWIEEVWRPGPRATFDELHAPDFRDRSPAGRGDGRDDFRRMLAEFYRAFPDFRAEVEDLVVDEARGEVAIRWRARATHRGSYLGVPTKGRALDFAGIEVIRVAGGRVAERWGEWDGMGLLAQLGLWEPPASKGLDP
jgi:steroid delta-isomerase-like uncharacterized protein